MKLPELTDLAVPASRAAWAALPPDDAARLRAAWTADVLVVVEDSYILASVTDLPVQASSDNSRCVALHVPEAVYARVLSTAEHEDAAGARPTHPEGEAHRRETHTSRGRANHEEK